MENFPGDKKFEGFLNNDDDDNSKNGNSDDLTNENKCVQESESDIECMLEISMDQKRLLFDIIQQKMMYNSDVLRILSDIYLNNNSKEIFSMIKKNIESSEDYTGQMDSLMALLLDDMGFTKAEDDSTDTSNEKGPKND
jgi:hypothetical protein